MVEPGASSEEIREEVFAEFRSNMQEANIEGSVREEVLLKITSEDPPNEFSEELMEKVSSSSEDDES